MTKLCKILNDLSGKVYSWISDQPEVKEESITDWLLYELSKKSSQVAYKSFNRYQEAKSTGADWDWVFLFNDGLVRLRVQAKKLFDKKDNYPGLAHANQYGQQISMLISSAAAASPQAYPIYAFYSDASSATACIQGINSSTGAYISGAKTVDINFVNNRKKVTPAEVLGLSYPLSCLVCCPKANGGSALDLIKQIYYYFESDSESIDATGEYQGYSKDIPASIRAVIDNGFKFPEWWEQEYERSFSEVGAIVIMDVRT